MLDNIVDIEFEITPNDIFDEAMGNPFIIKVSLLTSEICMVSIINPNEFQLSKETYHKSSLSSG